MQYSRFCSVDELRALVNICDLDIAMIIVDPDHIVISSVDDLQSFGNNIIVNDPDIIMIKTLTIL